MMDPSVGQIIQLSDLDVREGTLVHQALSQNGNSLSDTSLNHLTISHTLLSHRSMQLKSISDDLIHSHVKAF